MPPLRVPSHEGVGHGLVVWVVFVFGFVVVSSLEGTWLFAFHLFSNNMRNR